MVLVQALLLGWMPMKCSESATRVFPLAWPNPSISPNSSPDEYPGIPKLVSDEGMYIPPVYSMYESSCSFMMSTVPLTTPVCALYGMIRVLIFLETPVMNQHLTPPCMSVLSIGEYEPSLRTTNPPSEASLPRT